jgi:hypothetical protein
MDELNHIHFDIVNDYIKNSKEGKIGHYMITVSRDGESPVRSIISFDNLEQALEGYEMYQDAGFAKDYLTVSMYEPSGKINTKVLKRNHAGDPSFVRQNYIDTVDALHKVKDKLNKEDYVFWVNQAKQEALLTKVVSKNVIPSFNNGENTIEFNGFIGSAKAENPEKYKNFIGFDVI